MTQSTPANGLVIDEIEVGSGETAVKGRSMLRSSALTSRPESNCSRDR